MFYATLHQCKKYLGLTDAETADDERLMEFLNWATGFIDNAKGRRMDVRQETRLYDVPANPLRRTFGVYPGIASGVATNKTLRLDDDLLSVVTLTNGDGTVIPAAGFWLKPANVYPRSKIKLKSDYTWEADSDGETEQVISVDGLWGYHIDYGRAWVDSGDELQLAVNASITTLEVSNVAGAADDQRSPRFQAGQLVCVDTEFMLVTAATAVADANDTLTVQRGANGTTAAAHPVNKPIFVYRPMGIVEASAVRLVAWRYAQKDTDSFDRTFALGVGTVSIPTALPADVRTFLGAGKVRL